MTSTHAAVESSTISTPRLMNFLALVILAGLAQYWVASIILVLGNKFNAEALLRDGGLYFFATSLTATSLHIVLDKGSLRANNRDAVVTTVFVALVFFTAVPCYAFEFFGISLVSNPPSAIYHPHAFFQIACAICAIVYAVYAAMSTGMLNRMEQ